MAAPEALAARPQMPGLPGGESERKINQERPPTGFVGIVSRGNRLDIAAQNGTLHKFTIPIKDGDSPTDALPHLFQTLGEIDNGTHWRTFGAVGLNGTGRDVAAQTWMQRGISTILFDGMSDANPNEVLERTKEQHTPFGQRKIEIGPDGRVYSSRLTRVEDYQAVTPEAVWRENMDIFNNIARVSDDVIFIDDNTTEKAGGVAGMNHPKQRIVDDYNELERTKIAAGEEGHPIDYRWIKNDARIDPDIAAKYEISLQDPELLEKFGEPDPDDPKKRNLNIFKLTKLRHVILQNDAEPDEKYTEKYDRLYHAWNETQYQLNLKPILLEAQAQGKKVALKLEDQQTWGQLKDIRKDFPQDDPDSDFLKIIARNHIHSRAELAKDPNSQQYPIAQSILGDLSHGIDLFMVHRSNDQVGRDEFVFRGPDGGIHPLLADKIVYAEASFDDLDGLGRDISDTERPLLYAENNYYLEESGQTQDDFDIPSIGIYARDDESKDKLITMLGYALFAKRMKEEGVPIDQIPQYRDIAMGATDDPSGARINTAFLIGLHPELANRMPDDIKDSFKGSDHHVIDTLQQMVAETPWLADKIKKYRFTYDKYDDRNRRAIEETVEFGVQPSSSEACEDEISRKIARGTYTAIANVGGMTPQVEDGVSGRIIDKTGDHREVEAYAQEMYWYFTRIYPDPETRAAFRQNVKAALKPQYTTIYNLAREFGASALVTHDSARIPEMVRAHQETTGHFPFVHDLLGEYKPQPETSTQQVIFSAN